MTRHILGVHWIPAHNRDSDLEYMRRLQPSSVKIIDPDVTQISRVFQAAPNSLIVLRNHPRSEQHDDVRRDPEATGRRHAEEWAQGWNRFTAQAQQRGLPMPKLDNVIVLGINEPHVWTDLDNVVRYTVAFLRECTALGLRAGALSLSVGWPANTGPDTPSNWEPYAPIESEIKRGNHYLFLHEYFSHKGVLHNWGWWCGRYEHCPWDVPIIIGECGLDEYVADGSVQKERRGWQGWMDAPEYVTQLMVYANRCAQDGRIVSLEPFTTDSADTWQSFETQPAHDEIVMEQWPVPREKHTIHAPTVAKNRPTGTYYVTAVNGLNVRKSPTVDGEKLRDALKHGEKVTVTGWFGEWAQVNDLTQWAHGAYLSQTKPAPTAIEPEPQPVVSDGIIDPRTATAILQVESGGQGFGAGGRLLIRFEVHLFNQHTNSTHANLFYHGDPAWTGHEWRHSEDDGWRKLHTGDQSDEWDAFTLASTLNREAALQSISMGAPQILGSNHRRIGYASAEAMFRAFSDRRMGMAAQMVGFTNFCLSSPDLMRAIAQRDFKAVARLYNGSGQVDYYAELMQAAYQAI